MEQPLERIVCAVVGAGPAGLMAAEVLAEAGFAPVVFDGAAAPARKFLLAGRGGLNLTHSEDFDAFLARYRESAGRLEPALRDFDPSQLRAWSAALGEQTFVGTSGRVFPRSFKAAPLLRAWLRRLQGLGATLRLRHRLVDLAPGRLTFATPEGVVTIEAGAIVLALGGASWPRLGADGSWIAMLERLGVKTRPLRPSNGGFLVEWSEVFRSRFVGAPIKGVAFHFGEEVSRGEAIVTAAGLEGGAIYALSALLRDAVDREGKATLVLDLKPDVPEEALALRLAARPGESLATRLRKATRLPPASVALLREAGPPPSDAAALARRIKACPLRLVGCAPIDRAISSAGGVAWESIGADFMLNCLPGLFVGGEMIDWEAPTGGYLLQACFATGAAAGRGAAAWLRREPV